MRNVTVFVRAVTVFVRIPKGINEPSPLPKDKSIFEQDAVLAYDARIPRRDPQSGDIRTVWNGYTTKPHPVTGKEVPDESARRALFDYTNPRRAEWPQADYITGNPPFIGASRMREALGDGYVEALRKVWKGDVPESADFVMFWWRKAAELVRDDKAKRFGFITTNSIHQTFNRRVIEPFLSATKNPLHLAYAIPDHPWIDSDDGAAVRIAMTVAAPGRGAGILEKVTSEQTRDDGENEVTLSRSGGVLAANLQIGADLPSVCGLRAKDKAVHDKGLVSVLKQLHDDLDAAVLEAYGWGDLTNDGLPWTAVGSEAPHRFGSAGGSGSQSPSTPAESTAGSPLHSAPALHTLAAEALEQQLLTRLVALNHERAAEEKRGLIRWLRPDYQSPATAAAQQTEIGVGDDDSAPDTAAPVILDWPTELPAQVAALRKLLPTVGQAPGTVTEDLAERLSACFGRKSRKRVDQITAILDTLKSLGLVT